MRTKEYIFGIFILIVVIVLVVRDPNIKEQFDVKQQFKKKSLEDRMNLIHKSDLNQTTEITQLPDSTKLKVGIVSMMRRPKDIDDWLEYHRAMGIMRFYIRLEDSEELEEYLDGQADITLEVGKSTGKDEYKEIQTRQCKMVDDALKKAQEDKMDWLIHIDSDELLDGDLDEFNSLSEKIRTIIMNNKNYDNHLLILMSIEDKKIWFLNGDISKGHKKIIVSTKNDKYKSNEITKENIIESTKKYYKDIKTFAEKDTIEFDNKNSQREYEYFKKREQKF